jgi:hypothetical protein
VGKLWRRPQATEWERLGLEHEVALHVRTFAAAERLDASVAMRTCLLQQMSSLGMTTAAMARYRWKIADRGTYQRGYAPPGEAAKNEGTNGGMK